MSKIVIFFKLLLLSVLGNVLQAVNISQLRESLMHSYDSSVRPNFGGLPVDVGVTAYVLSISNVDDENEEMTFSVYFRQMWKDPRLAFSENQWKTSTLRTSHLDIWAPDTFFPNEVDAKFHDVTFYNSFTRIHADGSILLSRRYTLDISCPMDFTYFPMDVQVCDWEIESYGFTMKDMTYSWAKGDKSMGVSSDDKDEEFKLLRFATVSKHLNLSSGNYSRLGVNFTFVRNAGYYVFHFYIPALLITAFAYLTVWLSSRATFVRLALSISALLIMTCIVVGGRIVTPTVSYLTPLDIYLGLSFIIVLMMVIYHAFVTSSLEEEFTKTLELSKNISSPFCQKLARIGFGISILVFNFLYWVIFTQSV